MIFLSAHFLINLYRRWLNIMLFYRKCADNKSLRINLLFRIFGKEPDGFVMLYKRLDVQSGRFRWPRNSQEVRQLSWQQFDWLMSGLEIEQPKSIRIKASVDNALAGR